MEVKPGLMRRRGIARWTRSMAFNTSARWGFQFRLAGIYLTRNWCNAFGKCFAEIKKIKARPKDGKVFKERRDSNWWDDRRMVGRRHNAPHSHPPSHARPIHVPPSPPPIAPSSRYARPSLADSSCRKQIDLLSFWKITKRSFVSIKFLGSLWTPWNSTRPNWPRKVDEMKRTVWYASNKSKGKVCKSLSDHLVSW